MSERITLKPMGAASGIGVGDAHQVQSPPAVAYFELEFQSATGGGGDTLSGVIQARLHGQWQNIAEFTPLVATSSARSVFLKAPHAKDESERDLSQPIPTQVSAFLGDTFRASWSVSSGTATFALHLLTESR